jgi:phosphoketolase
MKDEIIESLHFAFQKGYDRPEFSDWKWPHK